MAYLEGLLAQGETVQIKARQHVLFLILHAIPFVVATIALWVVALLVGLNTDWGIKNWVALILVVVSLVPLVKTVHMFLTWLLEQFVVTNYRIIQTQGLLNKRTFDSALDKVNDVMMTQTLFGRLFGYGNIEIITGSDIGVNNLRGIAQPAAFKRALLESKTTLEHGDRFQPRVAAAQPVAGANDRQSADVLAALNELTNLRETGVITADEYETRAKQLLRQ